MRHKNELSGGHWTFMRKMSVIFDWSPYRQYMLLTNIFRLTDFSGSTEFPLVSPDEMIMESTTGDMMYKEMFIFGILELLALTEMYYLYYIL